MSDYMGDAYSVADGAAMTNKVAVVTALIAHTPLCLDCLTAGARNLGERERGAGRYR